MTTADPLAEYFASRPRRSSGLSGRSGVHGQVDAILNELEVPAELDKDGDWKLQTDVGPFLLIVDKESSDLVVVQTIQSMERKVKNSADEMHVLLALNFEARGIARFGTVQDSGQNLLVLTARLAPEEITRESVQAMLRDSLRLSRRVDELLGNAPAQAEGAAAEPAPAPPPAGVTQIGEVPQASPPPAPADATQIAQAPQASPPPEPEPEPAPADATQIAAVQSPPPPEPSARQDPAPSPPPPPAQSLPPANWYADPYRQARLRYWDGQRWTEHTAQ